MHERIIVPLDGSEVGEAALPYVEQLVSKLSPEIKIEVTLLQVLPRLTHPVVSGVAVAGVPYTEEEMEEMRKNAMDYLNKVDETLSSRGATVTTRVAIGGTSEKIIEAAEEINADLIAMSTHGRSGLSRWAFGSVTDKVLRRARNVPILTVKAKEQK